LAAGGDNGLARGELLQTGGLDNGVYGKGRAAFALAGGTVAAVDDDGGFGDLVADETAGAATLHGE